MWNKFRSCRLLDFLLGRRLGSWNRLWLLDLFNNWCWCGRRHWGSLVSYLRRGRSHVWQGKVVLIRDERFALILLDILLASLEALLCLLVHWLELAHAH